MSGRSPFVAMMQAADLRDRHDASVTGRRRDSRDGRILVQRQMRSRQFVVRAVLRQETLESSGVEHDDVVEALRRTDPMKRST
jgi:hypothetical protein